MALSKNALQKLLSSEYDHKIATRNQYEDQLKEILDSGKFHDFKTIGQYLTGQVASIDRGLFLAHANFEPITKSIANGQPFSVIAGNIYRPTISLGYLSFLKTLRDLQCFCGAIIIPLNDLTDDVSNSVSTLKSLFCAMGFDQDSLYIFPYSQNVGMLKLIRKLSNLMTLSEFDRIYQEMNLNNLVQFFEQVALTLASWIFLQQMEILLPQPVMISVPHDNHSILKLCRSVSKSIGRASPSGLIVQSLPSLNDPLQSMIYADSGVITLHDTETVVQEKIRSAYSGSVGLLRAHRKIGGLPEICPIFQLIRHFSPSNDEVELLQNRYSEGKVTASELKILAINYVNKYLTDLRRKMIKKTSKFTCPIIATNQTYK